MAVNGQRECEKEGGGLEQTAVQREGRRGREREREKERGEGGRERENVKGMEVEQTELMRTN